MRFYLYDGKAAKGPYTPEELSKLPGYGPDSVVAPLGATAEADWKPAASFEALKAAFAKPSLCPKCRQANPKDAVFCNKCGAKMSGEAAPPPPALPPMAKPPAPAVAMPPMAKPPTPIIPLPSPSPAAVAVAAAPAPALKPVAAPAPSPLPIPISIGAPPSAVPPPASWKTPVLAGAAVVGAFFVFFVLMKPKNPAAQPEPQPEPFLQQPVPAPVSAPAPASPGLSMPPKKAPQKAAPPRPTTRKRRRKEAAPAPAAVEPAKILEELTKPAEEPAAPEKPKAEGGLALPGLQKPVDAKPTPMDDAAAAPELSSPALDAAREQFGFCHALRKAAAHADFYDTCLCRALRKVARDAYVEAADKQAAAQPAMDFAVSDARLLDPNTALITANWTAGGNPAGRRAETWKLEEGLWCLERR